MNLEVIGIGRVLLRAIQAGDVAVCVFDGGSAVENRFAKSLLG